MDFVHSLDVFGVPAKEIPCIVVNGAPTTSTAGAVGMFYMNAYNGDVYKCIAAADGVYTWKEFKSAAPESNGTGGGGTVFYVTITGADGVYTANKSMAEVSAAFEAGRSVYCIFSGSENEYSADGIFMPLIMYQYTMCMFGIYLDGTSWVVVFSDQEIATMITQTPRVDELPETLPNPNALTFKGAVSGTYDGSKAVEINIPTVAGPAGYTPVKGVDYWTPADREQMVQEVIAALGTPVFGTVDENNNIILTGELVDGTYTLKYEDADGNVTTIGTFDSSGGGSGDDLVSGYTNQIPISTDTDGSIYNGTGYKEKSRGNSSGDVVDLDYPDCEIPPFVTGFIPAATGAIIRLKNCYIDAGYGISDGTTSKYGGGMWGLRMGLYDASKTKVAVISWGLLYDGDTTVFSNWTKDSNGYVTEFTVATGGVSYIRLCLAATGSPADAVVTVNQEIN